MTTATAIRKNVVANTVKPGRELAEWLDQNWSTKVGMTNEEVGEKMGYKSPNIISMWRKGKSKVSLERLVGLSQLMKVDLAFLLPMWFEQQLGDQDNQAQAKSDLKEIDKVFQRLTTVNEFALIRNIRQHFGRKNPDFTQEQAAAVFAVATDPAFAEKVLELANKEGVATK